MRVLQISHYFPPETPGGAQGYVLEVAQALRDEGDEVAVISGCRAMVAAPEVRTTREEGLVVHRIERLAEVETYSGDFGSARIGELVEDLAVDFAPELVHVHHWHALTGDLVRRLKLRGFPVVITLHDLFTTCPRFFRLRDGGRRSCGPETTADDCAECAHPDVPHLSLEALAEKVRERMVSLQAELAAADLALTVSDAQRELLESIPGFEFRGLHTERIGFRADAEPPAPPPPVAGRLRIANWAGLAPHKGIHLILDAAARTARPDAFEIHLHGADGDAAYMEELREGARGLDVHFHGRYEASDRFTFAARYDLAVFPSLAHETHSLVVDEALRSRLPVVVSDRGAPRERIGDAGLALPAGDVDALARLFDALLEDPARLAAMRGGSHGARDLREHVSALRARYRTLPPP